MARVIGLNGLAIASAVLVKIFVTLSLIIPVRSLNIHFNGVNASCNGFTIDLANHFSTARAPFSNRSFNGFTTPTVKIFLNLSTKPDLYVPSLLNLPNNASLNFSDVKPIPNALPPKAIAIGPKPNAPIKPKLPPKAPRPSPDRAPNAAPGKIFFKPLPNLLLTIPPSFSPLPLSLPNNRLWNRLDLTANPVAAPIRTGPNRPAPNAGANPIAPIALPAPLSPTMLRAPPTIPGIDIPRAPLIAPNIPPPIIAFLFLFQNF